jgi:Flp pilus assembly pilin Flp
MAETLFGAAKPVHKGFGRADTGATAIEYALIAGIISIAIVVPVALTGNSLTVVYSVINTAMIAVVGN